MHSVCNYKNFHSGDGHCSHSLNGKFSFSAYEVWGLALKVLGSAVFSAQTEWGHAGFQFFLRWREAAADVAGGHLMLGLQADIMITAAVRAQEPHESEYFQASPRVCGKMELSLLGCAKRVYIYICLSHTHFPWAFWRPLVSGANDVTWHFKSSFSSLSHFHNHVKRVVDFTSITWKEFFPYLQRCWDSSFQGHELIPKVIAQWKSLSLTLLPFIPTAKCCFYQTPLALGTLSASLSWAGHTAWFALNEWKWRWNDHHKVM